MTKRNLGLDIARFTAILLVIVSHSRLFFRQNSYNFLSICGLLGVEIFFILSGFLIGSIIIKSILVETTLNSLKKFYIRRWFRTLPLYYLVLIIVTILNKGFISKVFLLFLQNFKKSWLASFEVSWSLSIEEWFYLIFPLILIISLHIFKNKTSKKKIFFMCCSIIFLLSFTLRIYMTLRYNPEWDYGIRKQIFLRMDALMFGVILSGIKFYFTDLYIKISKHKIIPYVFTILTLLISYIFIFKLKSGLSFNLIIFKIFLFPLISLDFSFLIMYLDVHSFTNIQNTYFENLITYISKISYGIYLFHWVIFNKLCSYQGLTPFICSLLLTITMSALSYTFYESPLLKLRDKITKS